VKDTCPTCGSLVEVHISEEGTGCYTPVKDQALARARAALVTAYHFIKNVYEYDALEFGGDKAKCYAVLKEIEPEALQALDASQKREKGPEGTI